MLASAPMIDLIEELMYRCWARRNYLPPELREEAWHPIILDEMDAKDRELAEDAALEAAINAPRHSEFVPLAPTLTHIIHPAHLDTREPHFVSIRHPAGSISVDALNPEGSYEFLF